MTRKQSELAVRYITDETAAGNKTESGLLAYNTKNRDTARIMAYETLRKPHVRGYVEELLEKADFGVEVRSSLLSELGHGRVTSTKTLTQRNKSGEIIGTQTIVADVPASVRLKALSEGNKIDGTADKAAAEVRIAEREYTAQRKKLLREAGL